MLSKREGRWCDKSCNGAGRFFARSQGEQGRVLAESLWDQQSVTFLHFSIFSRQFLSFFILYSSLCIVSICFFLHLPRVSRFSVSCLPPLPPCPLLASHAPLSGPLPFQLDLKHVRMHATMLEINVGTILNICQTMYICQSFLRVEITLSGSFNYIILYKYNMIEVELSKHKMIHST